MSQDRISQRKRRIDLLLRMIKENVDVESLDKIIAKFCVQTGVTEFTARRYLRLLIEAELVKG